MKEIKYIKGDATEPIGEGKKIICHVCNDENKWGAGFVLALSKKWKEPESAYRLWSSRRLDLPFKLGEVQFVEVEDDIMVANMIGQHGVGFHNGVPPIRYEAIRGCLQKVVGLVKELAKENEVSVHCPRFGAGLAKGNWSTIEEIIKSTLCENDIQVTVYDFD